MKTIVLVSITLISMVTFAAPKEKTPAPKTEPAAENSAAEIASLNTITFGPSYFGTLNGQTGLSGGTVRVSAAYDIFLHEKFSIAPRLGVTFLGYAYPQLGLRLSFWPTSSTGPQSVQFRVGLAADAWITGISSTPIYLYTGADLALRIPLSEKLVLDVPFEIGMFPYFSWPIAAITAGLHLGIRI